jgi:hypothetical protein
VFVADIKVGKFKDVSDPRLGRHIEHDARSKNFAFMSKAVQPKGITTHWRSDYPPLDQGDLGSCTGNAMAQWLNTQFGAPALISGHKGQPMDEADAVDIYVAATRRDKIGGIYPPTDTGSTGNAAAKAARDLGYIDAYGWLFSFSSVQAAIEKTPLTVGTLWTMNMYEPHNGLVTVGTLTDRNIAGGHQYLMCGIDWAAEVFEFRNSWGEWARPGGYFAIGFKDFRRLLEADGDVTVPRI